jgi:hypothetical protein
MRFLLAFGLVAVASAQLDTANSNAQRDGSEGQPPRWPMRDIASNVVRDATVSVRSFALLSFGLLSPLPFTCSVGARCFDPSIPLLHSATPDSGLLPPPCP